MRLFLNWRSCPLLAGVKMLSKKFAPPVRKNERQRMQARQGAAIKKMSGSECKPDAKRKRDSAQPDKRAQPLRK